MKQIAIILSAIILLLTGCTSVTPPQPTYTCQTEVFEIQTGDFDPRYNAVVSITNTGETALSIGYTAFTVEMRDGTLVATEDSSAIGSQLSVIAPGETGYYYGGRIPLPDNFDPAGEYVLKCDTSTIKVIVDCEPATLDVQEVAVVENDYSEVIGRVQNTTDREMDIDVVMVCYNAQDKIVTVGGTVVYANPGEEVTFDICNMAALGRTDIVRYEIVARDIIY